MGSAGASKESYNQTMSIVIDSVAESDASEARPTGGPAG